MYVCVCVVLTNYSSDRSRISPDSERASLVAPADLNTTTEKDYLVKVLEVSSHNRTAAQIRFIRKFIDHIEFFRDYSADVLDEVCRRVRFFVFF